ncbi:chromatin remodeling protein EBS-like [Vicia villosa]|uniref:chromatin remodeling protein EBS-like n=1 Tax=Vicia villosa TaxID=3911 RepID=UPI00273A84C8|nr:chromatin remodeling protein EBS-like [Vicia villosa]
MVAITMQSKNTYTIRGTKKIVRAGDCVSLRPTVASKPIMARIEKIESDNMNRTRVHVRWYYRPEEAIGGRKSFHGEKELFLSDYHDVHNADTIEGKVFVHTLKRYTKLATVGAEDYFCRFQYKVTTGTFKPRRVPVFCKCEMPYNPDRFMAVCGTCDERYHPECVGITLGKAMRLQGLGFACSDCYPSDCDLN